MTDAITFLDAACDGDGPAAGAARRAQRVIERQLEGLGRLGEAGLEIAQALEQEARAPESRGSLPAIAMAYARVSRAVRLAVMLQSKLLEDLRALEDSPVERAQTAEAAERQARFEAGEDKKRRVERIVERVARAERGEDEVEDLMDEAAERLDDEDLYGEIVSRPVGEVVALICRDLGLRPDWARLAEEAWARAEIQAAPEGSPFLGLPGAGDVSRERDGSAALRPPPQPDPEAVPHRTGNGAFLRPSG